MWLIGGPLLCIYIFEIAKFSAFVPGISLVLEMIDWAELQVVGVQKKMTCDVVSI